MEEILSSIKRIIAEESETTPKSVVRGVIRGKAKPKAQAQSAESADEESSTTDSLDADAPDEILELTDPVTADADESLDDLVQSGSEAMSAETILSNATAAASRNSLAALSAMIVKPEDAPSNTLEGLVRDMLRPMLKEWLDANLPDVVEKMVAKEIARLTERQF